MPLKLLQTLLHIISILEILATALIDAILLICIISCYVIPVIFLACQENYLPSLDLLYYL